METPTAPQSLSAERREEVERLCGGVFSTPDGFWRLIALIDAQSAERVRAIEQTREDMIASFRKRAEKADRDLSRRLKIIQALSDPALPWVEIKDGDDVLVRGHFITPVQHAERIRTEVERMREAAALIVERWSLPGIASEIRALPLEPKSKP